jgi:hypothetical protein
VAVAALQRLVVTALVQKFPAPAVLVLQIHIQDHR